MADLGQRYLVPANQEVELMDLEILIEAKKSQLVRIEQDIKDIKNMALKQKEREKKMIELELDKLTKDYKQMVSAKLGGEPDIIDVEPTT